MPVARSRTTAKSGIIGRKRNRTLPVRYVLIAKKSQTSGDRKFGQIIRSLGYGNNQNAGHGPAPACVDEAEDRRDERAGVADADPEDEVRDVEAPVDRPANAGDAEA